MAEKKTEEKENAGEQIEESSAVMARKMNREKVSIRLPRAGAGQEETVFVGVNGKAWRIRRGVTVEVPAAVAEVLRNSEKAQDKAAEYEASMPKAN